MSARRRIHHRIGPDQECEQKGDNDPAFDFAFVAAHKLILVEVPKGCCIHALAIRHGGTDRKTDAYGAL
jgi:hypothetical protein